MIGDRRDTRTPFDLQLRYADAMKAAGHHSVMLEARARDKEHHGLTAYAIELAARCAKGEGEAALRRVLAAR